MLGHERLETRIYNYCIRLANNTHCICKRVENEISFTSENKFALDLLSAQLTLIGFTPLIGKHTDLFNRHSFYKVIIDISPNKLANIQEFSNATLSPRMK